MPKHLFLFGNLIFRQYKIKLYKKSSGINLKVTKAFRIFLFLASNGDAANCLLTKENPDVIESTGTLLGQQYDPNKQCKLSHGSSSLICLVSMNIFPI